MMHTTAKSGETWKTKSRKGFLTVRFLQDVDTANDMFVDAVIVEGRAQYMSSMNRSLQRDFGQGTPGDTISMRTTLLTLIKKTA